MLLGYWDQHPIVIIILAVMAIPLFGIVFGAWTTWLHFQHRREALETLKIYAQQGKTPPPEVLEALGGSGSGGGLGPDPGLNGAPPFPPGLDGLGAGLGDRYSRRAERYAWRAARWRYREPYRRWNGAVTLVALTAGFGFASQHANGDAANAFMLVAIILGACAIGAVITALLSTFLRP